MDILLGNTIAECQESMKPQSHRCALHSGYVAGLTYASWKSAIVRAGYYFASVVVVGCCCPFLSIIDISCIFKKEEDIDYIDNK
jgi:hypothetical protein